MERVGAKMALDMVRRTAPLKVTIGLLYRELDATKNDQAVTIDRALFESVIHTLELSIEDLEVRLRNEERKVGEGQPRIASAVASRP